jgi:CRISPR-associated protein Csx17
MKTENYSNSAPVILTGCTPIPLAHYLKALGVLRLVAESEHGDAFATGRWTSDQLLLTSSFDRETLVSFFLKNYAPTAVLAPWNGGSGFFPKDNDAALVAIEKSNVTRLATYRDGIAAARAELQALGLKAKPDGGTKALLLQSCRNSFPEDALAWLDAVFVLGQDGAKFPPLLGTGGNDGRLEFTNNFMQRITEVMDSATGASTADSERWLRAALFATPAPGLAAKAPIGQFFPGAAGGANGTSGFDAPSAVNPWDFILMIEGALLFAAASVRRLESVDGGLFIYPFCVRQAGVGYASAAGSDEKDARCEMWMPLWNTPTTLPELRAIFSEGRAQVRGRAARSGVDFAQAAVTLGVDRGIAAFQRYGFQVRNGLSYFATPLERVIVRRNARADLLADVEHWHDRLRQKAGPTQDAPASVARALNLLERRIVEMCREDSTASSQAVIAALGNAERALAKSYKWTTESAYLRPLHGLKPQWLTDADDGSTEFRLAASLAGMRAWLGGKETLYFRQHLEPLEMGANKERSWASWDKTPSNDVVWHDGDLSGALNAILARRLVRVEKSGARGWPDFSPCVAKLTDITAFIEGRTNDALLADLIWGLSLVDWETILRIRRSEKAARLATEANAESNESSGHTEADAEETPQAKVPSIEEEQQAIPSAFYALLRLCFRAAKTADTIPLDARILNRAMSGDGTAASELAARRLRTSGKAPLVASLPVRGDIARRTAAAMLFPIGYRDFRLLEHMILKQPNQQNT